MVVGVRSLHHLPCGTYSKLWSGILVLEGEEGGGLQERREYCQGKVLLKFDFNS